MEGRFANDTMAREVRCRTVALKFTANYGAHANITIHMKIALYEGDRPFPTIAPFSSRSWRTTQGTVGSSTSTSTGSSTIRANGRWRAGPSQKVLWLCL